MTEVVLHISRLISANALWAHPAGHRSRVRSAAYRAWIEEIGWSLRQQLIGVPTIVGTFRARIEIPRSSRMDRDNCTKAIFDILQHVRAIRNDSGLLGYEVVPEERQDVLVVLTDTGGAEQREPKVWRASKARSARPTQAKLAAYRRAGVMV